ncbi:MAG: hypothetical protein AAF193_09350 [Bacteroidota bacterium]
MKINGLKWKFGVYFCYRDGWDICEWMKLIVAHGRSNYKSCFGNYKELIGCGGMV